MKVIEKNFPRWKFSAHKLLWFLLVKGRRDMLSVGGQTWWHFVRPLSTMVVNMMMSDDWHSQTMYQKSVHVDARGPWVAMYLPKHTLKI